jgi:hypothetical protein
MRNLIMVIAAIFGLMSCTSTNKTANIYDDVYYTPKSNQSQLSSNESGVIFSGTSDQEQFSQSSTPKSSIIENENEEYLPATDQGNEYYYAEEEDEYYDYDYASRLNRFHGANTGFGYYDPFYTGMYPSYGSSFSLGIGMGFPSSYFSLAYNYGWGSPFMYDPWYDPWYSPWSSWYNPWRPSYGFGGSYWMGYNHGFWNGYYAGGGNTWYPGEATNPGYYYGPRGSRGSTIVGNQSPRGTRVNSDEDELKSSVSPGRNSRMGGTTVTSSGAESQTTSRSSRANEVRKPQTSTEQARDARTDKMVKPGQEQNVTDRPARDDNKTQAESTRRYSRPAETTGASESAARSKRLQEPASTPARQNAKPVVSDSRNDVQSRTKRYAKPASESISRTQTTSEPKRYTAPNTNRMRSSNEYTVPRSQPVRTYTTPSRSENSFQNRSNTRNTSSSPTRTYTPVRQQQPTRSYSPPPVNRSRSTTPARSYTAPVRSSGSSGTSISTPSRSSGSSGSKSTGTSSGGRRGR